MAIDLPINPGGLYVKYTQMNVLSLLVSLYYAEYFAVEKSQPIINPVFNKCIDIYVSVHCYFKHI